ncbi:MAG TPA: nucleoside 2-deoxyribosyltransferase domain-containing protein [Bellilinea sp.]|nr:nucleoside 2-deoxyribosyltransferase domain-containing protein [Bellilinea sp.]
MNKLVVYLAGGLYSSWQNVVSEYVYEALGRDLVVLLNPQDHDSPEEDAYTTWDLEAIRQADIVFAYIERDNPSGVGTSLEIGYARALGKIIILVDEKQDSHFGMARVAADVVFNDFQSGMLYLYKLLRMRVRIFQPAA